MLNVYKIKRRFDETSIKAAWPQLMGASVANRTTEIYIYHKKLFLRIESSVIRHEIMLMHESIILKINEKAASNLVDEIIFL